MLSIFEKLSGGIPGGAVLLISALIFINLALFFFKSSGLFNNKRMTKKVIISNLFIVLLYSLLWVYTHPDPLPERIVVLPTNNSENLELNSESLFLAELFQLNNYNIQGRYIVHNWRWMYRTMDKDSLGFSKSWSNLGEKLNPSILITSQKGFGTDILIKVIDENKQTVVEHTLVKTELEISFIELLGKLNLKTVKKAQIVFPQSKYLNAGLKIIQDQPEIALKLMANDTSLASKLIQAEAFVIKGLQFKYNYVKLKYVKIINPDFEQAKAILYPIIKSRKDLPIVTYLLGRITLREQDYESAEVFLKKTYIEELWNSRVYYHLSHLLSSRLEEIGFKNRFDVLEKSVHLDPGYTQAVLDLANEAYLRGTGAEQGKGTQYALKTLEDFLFLNENDPQVLSLLATFYIKTEKLDQAEDIYNQMLKRYPKDSNLIYDLGIVSYVRYDYEKALDYFKQAISMDGNLDAYLYAGITLEMMGDKKQALEYYKDRVRFKESDDDLYAKEAMRGIRNILEDFNSEKQDSLTQ